MNLRHRRFITAVIFVIVCAAGAVAQNKLLTIEESRTLMNRFRQGMIGYTYLDRE